MPPGNARTKPSAKVLERASVEACLAIAKRVQHTRRLSGDEPGSQAVGQVVELIHAELLHEEGPRLG